jgi:hypothetical protein
VIGSKAGGQPGKEGKRVDRKCEQQPAEEADAEDTENE